MSRVRLTALACFLAIVAGTAVSAFPAGAASSPKDVTITLVTHDSFAASDSVLAAFTKQTGIHVKVLKSGDAGAALSQVILTKDAPLGDVFYGVDNTFLSRALDGGVFEKYAAPALSNIPSEYKLDPSDRANPVDHADVCVVADSSWLADHKLAMPNSLEDLTKPAYKSKLVVENPATSSPGLAFLLSTVAHFGNRSWSSYWDKLRANDVKVVDGWSQAYNDSFTGGGGSGDRPLVVSYASDPAAAVYFADNPKPTTSPIATLQSTCFRQVEFVGVLKGTQHRAAARQLVDFMLSAKFQEDMPLQMFVFPVLDGAKLPAVFTKFADAPKSPLSLSPSTIAKGREGWIKQWTDTVIR